MTTWIEVKCGTDSLEKKLEGKEDLISFRNKKIFYIMSRVEKGDIIFHYLKKENTLVKMFKSAFVAKSIVTSEVYDNGKKYIIDLSNTCLLENPVPLKLVKQHPNISSKLLKASKHMNGYILEIDDKDIEILISLSKRKGVWS